MTASEGLSMTNRRGISALLYYYYGVHGNSASLHVFFTCVMRILFTWLNRRSQRRSYTWTGFRDLLHHFRVERPHIVGRPPPRLAAGRA